MSRGGGYQKAAAEVWLPANQRAAEVANPGHIRRGWKRTRGGLALLAVCQVYSRASPGRESNAGFRGHSNEQPRELGTRWSQHFEVNGRTLIVPVGLPDLPEHGLVVPHDCPGSRPTPTLHAVPRLIPRHSVETAGAEEARSPSTPYPPADQSPVDYRCSATHRRNPQKCKCACLPVRIRPPQRAPRDREAYCLGLSERGNSGRPWRPMSS